MLTGLHSTQTDGGIRSIQIDRKKVYQNKRTEGKLKRYNSCRDVRAWTLDKYERQRYIRDYIAAPIESSMTEGGAFSQSSDKLPLHLLLGPLLSAKNQSEKELQEKIKQLLKDLKQCSENLKTATTQPTKQIKAKGDSEPDEKIKSEKLKNKKEKEPPLKKQDKDKKSKDKNDIVDNQPKDKEIKEKRDKDENQESKKDNTDEIKNIDDGIENGNKEEVKQIETPRRASIDSSSDADSTRGKIIVASTNKIKDIKTMTRMQGKTDYYRHCQVESCTEIKPMRSNVNCLPQKMQSKNFNQNCLPTILETSPTNTNIQQLGPQRAYIYQQRDGSFEAKSVISKQRITTSKPDYQTSQQGTIPIQTETNRYQNQFREQSADYCLCGTHSHHQINSAVCHNQYYQQPNSPNPIAFQRTSPQQYTQQYSHPQNVNVIQNIRAYTQQPMPETGPFAYNECRRTSKKAESNRVRSDLHNPYSRIPLNDVIQRMDSPNPPDGQAPYKILEQRRTISNTQFKQCKVGSPTQQHISPTTQNLRCYDSRKHSVKQSKSRRSINTQPMYQSTQF